MTSVVSKVRTILLANVHAVLDKVIDMNSIGAIEQHIRDLENNRKELEGQLAEARFVSSRNDNIITNGQKRIDELEAAIAHLSDDKAMPLSIEINRITAEIEDHRSNVDTNKEQAAKLENIVSSLITKETEMKRQVQKLKSMQATTVAQNRATAAIEAAGKATEGAGSIDNLADKIERANARSNAAFDKAVNTLPDTSVADASAAATLARIRAKQQAQQ